ncbi:MAG: DinB family protein [Chitinophagaceae bacterium]|nr:DinB family protein [Chitinophagaceae bacterium]
MGIRDSFIAELKQESALTKKILERVPLEHRDWQPHSKSMSIGRLATHIAEIPHWIKEILSADEYDFATKPFKLHVASSQDELMTIFSANIDNALAELLRADDEAFKKRWTIKRGTQVIMSPVKEVAIRGWAYSHLYHHRGQLTVFLRLLDLPVPGMYGPTADERL